MSDVEKKEDVKGGEYTREDEIASKLIANSYKRFYVDVKQNARTRLVKIAEIGSGHKSRVVLTFDAAAMFTKKLIEYIQFCEDTPEDPTRDSREELKTDMLDIDSRRYYIDLKENQRGRYLRLTSISTNRGRPMRSSVSIPSESLTEMKEVLESFIEEYGKGYMDVHDDQLNADLNKVFYFDVKKNDNGSFIRIAEWKQGNQFRGSITIPMSSYADFKKTLEETAEKVMNDHTDVEG